MTRLRPCSALPPLLILMLEAHGGVLAGFGNPLLETQLIGATQVTFDSVGAQPTFTSLTVGNVTFNSISGFGLHVSTRNFDQFNTIGLAMDNFPFDSPSIAQPGDHSGFEFLFANPVDAFATNFGATSESWTLQAFDAVGALIESVPIPAIGSSNFGHYWGLSATGIVRATLTPDAGTFRDLVTLDNFTYLESESFEVGVPAPLPAGMLAGGLAWVVLVRRRRPLGNRRRRFN